MLTDKQNSFKKRVIHLCYPFFAFAALIFPFSLPVASELDEVRLLSDMNAASLSLQLIDKKQQSIDVAVNLPEWIVWERERLIIYTSSQKWNEIINRIKQYKTVFPQDFSYFVLQKELDALLKLKKTSEIRDIVRPLIWSDSVSAEEIKWLPKWQKYIIKSYIAENAFADAHLAAQRFYQDYPFNELEDRLLRARILLMNNRADEVVSLLEADTNDPLGGMLYLLAQLRSGERASRKVLQSALRQMQGKWVSDELKFMLWAVVAEAAKNSGDRVSAVNALEHVTAGNKNVTLPEGIFNLSPDALWNAYIDYALYIGNRKQYLVGNDQQWLDAAKKAEKKYPVKARSLYAMIIVRGQQQDKILEAANAFLALMHKRYRGAEVVNHLFLKSQHFSAYNLIPEPIRFDLIDIALSRSNIELASNIMTTINEPPQGANPFDWSLRRARVFILGGKLTSGINAINQLLDNKLLVFNSEQLDKLLQIVFDIQTLKQHEDALTLFSRILEKTEDKKLQREIYYWMADSKNDLHKYSDAAHLYLRSAIFMDGKGFDPWGQTARYQAATALGKAGLIDDAHNLYNDLLDVTKDPARRSVLQHEQQKLWLSKKTLTGQ